MNSEAGAVWLVRFWDGLFLGWFVFEMVVLVKFYRIIFLK